MQYAQNKIIKSIKYFILRIYLEIKVNFRLAPKITRKISVIIPTIWRSEFIVHLVSMLNTSDYVGEIILVDNMGDNGRELSQFSKVKIFNASTNFYVNPSWNLGVQLAKYEIIALCNDDILFDPILLKYIHRIIRKSDGLIGVDKSCLTTNIRIPWIRYKYERDFPFGILMFFFKENYVTIPDELKVWFGDDYLFKYMSGAHLAIKGFQIHTKMSSSSSSSEFDFIKQNDKLNWEKYQSE